MVSSRKAFLVQSREERQIIFARGYAEAQRIGQSKVGKQPLVYRRLPALDRYAESGEVPMRELIEKFGWSMCCRRCSRPVSGQPADEPPMWDEPVYHRNMVFCSEDCRDEEETRLQFEERRSQQAARAALQKWPGISIVHVQNAAQTPLVVFTYPGCSAPAQWYMDDEHPSVPRKDMQAWIAFVSRAV